LTLLEQAGLAYKAYHSSAQGLPLEAQIDPKKFKVFCLDIGLAHRILRLPLSQLYLQKKDLLANRGAVAEQFVAQEILSYTRKNTSPRLFYWHREARASQAEVDLVTESQSSVLPIEIKSDRGGSSKSLSLFLREKRPFLNPKGPQALRLSKFHYGVRDGIVSLPFYALMKYFRVS